MSFKSLVPIGIFIVGFLLLNAETVHGHGWGGGDIGCSIASPSCGPYSNHHYRRRQHSPFPRRYQYHRRGGSHPLRPSSTTMDMVLSKLFAAPSDLFAANSLLRRHNGPDRRWVIPSVEDMACSIKDRGDGGVEILVDVLGADADNITVEVDENNLLVISGRIQNDSDSSRMESEFSRSFCLNEDIDVNGIQVALSSGLLTVTAPRKQHAPARRKIPIRLVEREEEFHSRQVEEADATNDSIGLGEVETEMTLSQSQDIRDDDDDFQILDEKDAWE